MDWPVRPMELPGRGMGLVAVRDIAPGEIVMQEEPLILYPNELNLSTVCGSCLRMLEGTGSAQPQQAAGPCLACGIRFCSLECQRAASSRPGGTHRPCVCRGMAAARQRFADEEEVEAAHFSLICCDLLAEGSPESKAKLAALEELTTDGPDLKLRGDFAAELKQLVDWTFAGAPAVQGVTAEQLCGILKRERINSFGIMTPPDGERNLSTRGTGVYPQCARMNHACFPNVARFDDFDAPAAGAAAGAGPPTAITLRAMDGIKAGAEALTAYFPVSWGLEDRQEHLEEEYGFTCRCERCTVEMAEEGALEEAMEADSDSEGAAGGAGAHAGAGGEQQQGAAAAPTATLGADPALRRRMYALWFLKFMCPEDGCGGSLAPPATTADAMVCNYCGRVRTDKEFFEELGDRDSDDGE